MTTWSHSRLEAYEDCPRKYKYRYIDKIEPERKSIYLFLGSVVHKVLEKLYDALHYDNIPPVEALLEELDRLWQTEDPARLVIPGGRTAEDFRHLGRRCIQDYYKRHYPFNEGATLGAEVPALLEIPDGDGNIKVFGKIDRLSRAKDGTIQIHDYKTGKVQSQAALDRDRQLALYQIAVQQRWPDGSPVELVWHYLAYDTQLQSRRTPGQLEQTQRDVVALVRQIESDEIFQPRKSPLCSYCEYQPICPLWRRSFQSESADPQTKPQLAAMADEYGELKERQKAIEAKLKEMKEQFTGCMEDASAETFHGKRWRVTLTRTEGIGVPPKGDRRREAIDKIFLEAGQWRAVSTLDTSLLKKMMARKILRADMLSQLEPLVTRERGFRCLAARQGDEKTEWS